MESMTLEIRIRFDIEERLVKTENSLCGRKTSRSKDLILNLPYPLLLSPLLQKAIEIEAASIVSVASQPPSYQTDYLFKKMRLSLNKLSEMELDELRIRGEFFFSL